MSRIVEAVPVPLRDDGQGGLRVGTTRVSLESVLYMYQQGASPVDIVRAFDTLELADVYVVLAWALRHVEQVDSYLNRREQEAAEMRLQLERAGVTPTQEQGANLKERLLGRRKDQERRGTSDATVADG
jgi:uncharacterized protein (DUF433 family)